MYNIGTRPARIAPIVLLVAILAPLLCGGCGALARRFSALQQHAVGCTGKTRAQVLDELTAMIASEGFSVTNMNERAGILEGERRDGPAVVSWQFLHRGDTVLAIARKTVSKSSTTTNVTSKTDGTKEVKTESGTDVTVESFGDEADKDVNWYWHVRDGLEKFCGAHVVVRWLER